MSSPGRLLGEPHSDRIEEPHRSQRGRLVGAGVGHRAGVADLGADRRPLGVYRLGEPAQSRHRMRAHPDLVAAGASAGGDRAIGDGGHGDPARGRQPVVLDQVIGHQRVRCAGLEGGGLDDPVTQRERTEFGRVEHVRGFAAAGSHMGSLSPPEYHQPPNQ